MKVELKNSTYRWSFKLKVRRAIWNVIWRLFGSPGPRLFSPWRKFLLKLFGARIGKAPLICGQIKVLMPWNLVIGDYVAISERVDIYNYDLVSIGENTVISQGTWLCTGSHDYSKDNFPLVWAPIQVDRYVWIASESFIAPGVSVGEGSVIGARSVVTSDVCSWSVYAGNPARKVKDRVIK